MRKEVRQKASSELGDRVSAEYRHKHWMQAQERETTPAESKKQKPIVVVWRWNLPLWSWCHKIAKNLKDLEKDKERDDVRKNNSH